MAKNNIEVLKQLLKKLNIFPEVARLKAEDNLFSLGALDSLTLIQYVLLIEDEFKIRFDNADINYERFMSFANIANLLSEKHHK